MTAQLSRERIEQYANDPRMCNVNEEIRTMARMLLAGLDSEPVAKVDNIGVCWYADDGVSRKPAVGEKLYAAPPAPVAVPYVGEFRIFTQAGGVKVAVKDGKTKNHLFGMGWNACRAAMLKAGPVTGWIKCSERMPEHANTVITSNGIDIGHAWWDGDRWFEDDPVAEGITHWMPRPAAPEQEV